MKTLLRFGTRSALKVCKNPAVLSRALLANYCSFGCACLLLLLGSTAFATPTQFTVSATNTVEINGDGALAGSSFFDLLGSSFGENASFGIADFNFSGIQSSLGGTVQSVSDVTLQLNENNNGSSPSVAGNISVFYTNHTSNDIINDGSLTDTGTGDGSASVGSGLTDLTLLGTAAFTANSSNPTDTFTLSFPLNSDQSTDFVKALNDSSKNLRLVITANDPATQANYAGITNTLPAPSVTFTVTLVPEPSAFVLGIFSLTGLLGLQKLRRTKAA